MTEKVFGGETIEFHGGIKRENGRKFARVGGAKMAFRTKFLPSCKQKVQSTLRCFVFCLDSMTVKVPPDACGALKKVENKR